MATQNRPSARINFSCLHCDQRLSVGSRKAGEQVTCPKCHGLLTVPAESSPTRPNRDHNSGGATRGTVEDDPLIGLAPPDSDTEWVVEEEGRGEPPLGMPRQSAGHEDLIAIPRRIVYLQGALLAAVAVTAFSFGILISGSRSERPTEGAMTPCVIRGRVQYTNRQNRPVADGGSVVIAVPQDSQPEPTAKVPIAEIVPTSSPIAGPARDKIRGLGGDLTVVRADGWFEIRLPQRGEYFVLVLSRNQPPQRDARSIRDDIGKVGRYFTPADELLIDYCYQWSSESVRSDRQLTVTF